MLTLYDGAACMLLLRNEKLTASSFLCEVCDNIDAQKYDADLLFSIVSFISIALWYVRWTPSMKCWLCSHRESSNYLKVIFQYFTRCFIICLWEGSVSIFLRMRTKTSRRVVVHYLYLFESRIPWTRSLFYILNTLLNAWLNSFEAFR